MRIVTIANKRPAEPYFCMAEMIASCNRFGHPPLLLGWGERWGGLGNKPRLLLRAIEEGRIKDSHLLLLDAFDTVLARPPCDIMAAYAEYHAPIVWGAERNLFPSIECDRDRDFPEHIGGGGFRYLNSGVCVAETDAMLAYLRHIDAANIRDDYRNEDGSMCHVNDQEIALRAFIEQPQCVAMALDRTCAVALNMHSVRLDELDTDGDQIRLRYSDNAPCIFHANGESKTSGMLALVLAKLGLR